MLSRSLGWRVGGGGGHDHGRVHTCDQTRGRRGHRSGPKHECSFRFLATRVGKEMVLRQIINMGEEAQLAPGS